MPNPVIVRRLLASGSGSALDPVWNGLTAYWKLEEATGDFRLDSSGNGSHLTDTSANVAQTASGIIGNAASLAASSSQSLEIADNSFVGVSGPGNSFSCSLWIKSSGTANAAIIGKWASVDNVLGQGVMDWLIGMNGGNNLCVNVHGPGFFDTGIIFGGSLNNTWQHLAITFSASTHTLLRYLNGSLVGTTVEIADVQRSSAPFAIFNYGTVHAASIVGSIDEVGLWGRALTATEVSHLYNSGSGLAYPSSVSALTQGQKWALRVTNNGGAQPSAATITALDAFYSGIVADGLGSKLVAFNALVPDSLIAAQTPLITGPGLGLWTNNGGNFVSGDLTVNGLAGNATNRSLSTGVAPNVAGTASSIGMFFIVSADSATGTQEDMGCNDGATHSFTLSPHFGTTNRQFACWSFATGGTDYVNGWTVPTPATGFYSGQRTANNAIAVYFANVATPHAALATGSGVQANAAIATAITLFADNVSGTPSNFSAKRLSCAGVTTGLSSAEDSALYARLSTLRQALGGGNP